MRRSEHMCNHKHEKAVSPTYVAEIIIKFPMSKIYALSSNNSISLLISQTYLRVRLLCVNRGSKLCYLNVKYAPEMYKMFNIT